MEMTYTLRVEEKIDVKTCRRMLKAPDGNYYDHIPGFCGMLHQVCEDVVEVFNIQAIEQTKIAVKQLRQEGVGGIIAVLENCDGQTRELKMIPAILTKEDDNSIKERWQNLNGFVKNARMAYADLQEEDLAYLPIEKSKRHWMLLAEEIFPNFEVGDVTTIGKLWKNGINIEFDFPIPPIGDWAECKISEYGYGKDDDCMTPAATLYIWYELAHDVPELYSDGEPIGITNENIGTLHNVEIKITRITNR